MRQRLYVCIALLTALAAILVIASRVVDNSRYKTKLNAAPNPVTREIAQMAREDRQHVEQLAEQERQQKQVDEDEKTLAQFPTGSLKWKLAKIDIEHRKEIERIKRSR